MISSINFHHRNQHILFFDTTLYYFDKNFAYYIVFIKKHDRQTN